MDKTESAKVQSAELRKFADEESGEPVTVLIELDLPQRRLVVDRVDRGGMSIKLPVGIETEAADERKEVERRINEGRAFLEDELKVPARWLPSASSFVADVTPEQLRAIIQNPLIKAVWPNRELQSPYSAAG